MSERCAAVSDNGVTLPGSQSQLAPVTDNNHWSGILAQLVERWSHNMIWLDIRVIQRS
jgi:hypothetical protein